ncbi:MAG: alanine:cation symporter family protein, partial [candidate division Zixibacteria bacterium]|nr:alanine:cation symporter family protein [candidate division Zixibacteria bacterium]NIX56349.1 amino acid carrier protein [candidate division Zixibacteria bacterium]
MVIILLGTGIFITFRLGWIQLFKVGHALNVLRGKFDDPDDEGDINHFQALSAALSATVGIGNIAGVATAIYYGGPGALFWMWITAIFGMALKFTEATLAMNFRTIHEDGSASGGPMYYIEKGLGKNWKPLAMIFAALAVICSFGTGNAIQAFTVSDQFLSDFVPVLSPDNWFITPVSFLGIPVEPVRLLSAVITTSLVALVILGGIKRIGQVAARLAPGMAIIYVVAAFLIIVMNYDQILPTFGKIFSQAFTPRAELLGVGGGSFMIFLNTMVWGVKRGLFSNEAGQGSAPIAHAAAKTKEPVREGAVAMVGPLVDTLIICTLTGLVIVITNSHEVIVEGARLNGSPLTAHGFQVGLAPLISWGDKIITVAVFLFAVSTSISWSYYGDRSAEYLIGERAIRPYKMLYVIFHFIGAIVSLEIVWGFGDIALGLMAVPNLIAL